ncbi:MAG TPA: hypothetical protein ENI87_11605 [bacterium]|nr:hypothetical protein [bacterium]
MTDDEGDKITEPQADAEAATEVRTESANAQDREPAPAAGREAADEQVDNKLGGLMADAADKGAKPAVDLDAEARRAAEAALAEGEKALAAAREHLAGETIAGSPPKATQSRRRELLLRTLLAVNILAMVVVALLPQPAAETEVQKEPDAHEPVPAQPKPDAATPTQRMSEPVNRALVASERGDFARAIEILEQYLTDYQGMPPSERLIVLQQLSWYSLKAGRRDKSEVYGRQAMALENSHNTPEDLVAEAEAALANGDQESLRRIWARFLLQQRQIPGYLYEHVARAYLQLGDSYRQDADAAEAAARERELLEANARLRAEVLGKRESPR